MSLTTLQQQWVDLLLTTELPQGVGYLKRDGAYCCLGLAAEFVLRLEEKVKPTSCVSFFEHRSINLSLNNSAELGLEGVEGSINIKGLEEDPLYSRMLEAASKLDGTPIPLTLATLNDKGFTFREIGEFIQRNPEVVFPKEKIK